jgi:hypothetical protein
MKKNEYICRCGSGKKWFSSRMFARLAEAGKKHSKKYDVTVDPYF